MGLSIWKVFFVLPEITFKAVYPYGALFLFGAACVAYTLKSVVDMGRNKLKK